MAGGFLEAGPHPPQKLPRRFVLSIPPAQITGIVKNRKSVRGAVLGELEASLLNKVKKVLRMVPNPEVTSKLGILIFEGIEAVGASGDDFLDFVGLEGLDVLEGQHLEEEVVTGAFGGVSSAGFFGAEDAPLDAGSI